MDRWTVLLSLVVNLFRYDCARVYYVDFCCDECGLAVAIFRFDVVMVISSYVFYDGFLFYRWMMQFYVCYYSHGFFFTEKEIFIK